MGIDITVIGASGATGKELAKLLLSDTRVNNVTVLLRRPFFSPHQKLKEIIVDFNQLDQFSEYIQGSSIVFHTMGTTLRDAGSKEAQWLVDVEYPLNFAKIARQNGVPTFVLLSAQGANPNSSVFYSKMKGQLEKEVIELKFPRLVILRPGIIERPNSTRFFEKLAVKSLHIFNKIGLLTSHRPINTTNLAKALVKASLPIKEDGRFVFGLREINQLVSD